MITKEVNYEEFEPNYNKWFKEGNIEKITKKEAIYLFYGLEPKLAKEYFSEKYEDDKECSEEDNIFWKDVTYFLVEKRGCFNRYTPKADIDYIDRNFKFNNDIFSFVSDLYNAGHAPCDILTNYLNSIGKKPRYSYDSWVYKLFEEYSKKDYWSLEELRYLVLGIHPRNNKKKMVFLNNNSGDRGKFFYSTISKYHKIELREEDDYVTLEEYLTRYENIKKEGDDELYKKKKILNVIIEETEINPPQILIDLVFDYDITNIHKNNQFEENLGKYDNLITQYPKNYIGLKESFLFLGKRIFNKEWVGDE